MSQSPKITGDGIQQENYLNAFRELAQRIRQGASFSGRERNCALLNTGGGRFADISAVSGFAFPLDGRGMALSDWDHDGDLDLWLSNRNAPRLQFLQNTIPPVHSSWLAVRLHGDPAQGTNRDAIGSRVELLFDDNGKERVVQTLHAGNGLMSQSSKWIHFGLSGKRNLKAIRIHWAGGKAQTFAVTALNERWHLRQRTGQARAHPTRPRVALAPKSLFLPEPTEVARIRLSQPLQIPDLYYQSMEGRSNIKELTKNRAVLVNLWATWCAPCVEELKAFGAAHEKLAQKNLTVLALNVDHLGAGKLSSAQEAQQELAKLGFHMAGGIADPELVELLAQSILKTVYRHRQMPVPISFLIDRGGWLSAIYKGPVSIEQVLADRAQLGKSQEAALAAAVPFRGTWSHKWFVSNPVSISATHLEGGYYLEAREVLETWLAENDGPPGNSTNPKERLRNRQLGGIHFHLAEVANAEKKFAEAVTSYRKSLSFDPRQVPALHKLAWLLATSEDASLRNGPEALKHAQFLMQAPGMNQNPSVLGTLAAAHAATGDFGSALNITDKAIALLTARKQAAQAEIHRQRRQRYEAGKALP